MACKEKALRSKDKKVQEKISSLMRAFLAKSGKYHYYKITTD